MKQLILFLFTALLLTSCNEASHYTEEQSKKNTTLELIELPKGTIAVSIVEGSPDKMYVFNEQLLITDEYVMVTNSDYVPSLPFGYLMLFILLGVAIGILIGITFN